ncbi:MAG: M48 family metallopeptidase [Blastocatellia bacterium]
MRNKSLPFRLFVNTLLTAALALGPALAQSTTDSAKQKPLEDKQNPRLIGRRDINKGQMDFYSLDKEIALGRQIAAETERELKLVDDPLVNEFVNRVAQNIVLNSDSKVPFTIKVVESNEVNAFALPGGHLYVNRGLIEAAENEAELAGVIAHEIAHVAARHGVEQASKAAFMNYASIPLIFLGGIGGYAIQQAMGLAVPLTFLKFSRGAEKEADALGAQYMWAAGYDPNAMITFFEKLQQKDKKKPGTIVRAFSTHPLTDDRIKEVRGLLVRFPDRAEYQVSTSDFDQVRGRLLASRNAGRILGGPDNSGRPTLKRGPRTDNPSADASAGSSAGSMDGQSGTDTDSAPGRPTLKRRSDTQTDDTVSSTTTGETNTESAPGRPTLKRRSDPR